MEPRGGCPHVWHHFEDRAADLWCICLVCGFAYLRYDVDWLIAEIERLSNENDMLNQRNEGLKVELSDQQKYVLHLERSRVIDCNSGRPRQIDAVGLEI